MDEAWLTARGLARVRVLLESLGLPCNAAVDRERAWGLGAALSQVKEAVRGTARGCAAAGSRRSGDGDARGHRRRMRGSGRSRQGGDHEVKYGYCGRVWPRKARCRRRLGGRSPGWCWGMPGCVRWFCREEEVEGGGCGGDHGVAGECGWI